MLREEIDLRSDGHWLDFGACGAVSLDVRGFMSRFHRMVVAQGGIWVFKRAADC